ncbi:unnamed protein product [Phytomonas sp. EM1]|nr:unnamed protein product [Phytomonas sp. EM1]|eukprot:CCW63722.1 unnamed protein product [Phytomonas sp. isolate EM1]
MSDKKPGMRAVILVGGFGTRLRPLTFTVPKPLVPICNKPMIIHQVEALKKAGVTEVILAVAYRAEVMKAEMDKWASKIGISFVYSVEDEPLGTAGPLSLMRDILMQDDNPFFVLNSDVVCEYPLEDFIKFHRGHGKEGSIMVAKVKDWDRYGAVIYDEKTLVIRDFVEKPKEFVGDRINAGIYIFNKSILSRIPLGRTSIERQIFPKMAIDGELCAYNLEGFWMDIGQPHDFITGMSKLLPFLDETTYKTKKPHIEETRDGVESHFKVCGNVLIDPSATIGAGSVIGPDVSIGANCKIGPCCHIHSAAIFDNTTIGTATVISKSIIGWNNRIGSWCHVANNSVLGNDVEISDDIIVNCVKVLPNKSVSKNCFEPEILM